MPEFTDDAVAIGADNLYQQTDATRAVALEGGLFVNLALKLAGATKNGALDIFVRHVFVFTGEDCGA
jgi:hypothetical protein